MDVELYGEDAAATTGTGNDSATNTDTTTTTTTPTYKGDPIHFTLSCNKKTYPIDFGSDETVTAFQLHAATLTGVPVALQKLVFKGPVRDASKTLRETGIGQGSKLMLFGSTLTQVMEVNQKPDQSQLKDDEPKKEALCDQTKHKKILEKGLPDNAGPGILNSHEPLPEQPLAGILNNIGTAVRLTFKPYSQELWISSKSNTQQLPFGSIKSVASEPIKGKEEYHIVSLQLGPSEGSRYFLYFVPAQYVRAIKTMLMGYL
eukprot:TRINITY_DN3654_c0_g1_i1.p1 TRINITY_DN3654_c0_g1~~TRINITY_DN3654_c0_g1_i1.p1  ORF type:complete len:276 (-),score=55.48 TRINITY_DN3654_c0_g1_i1:92-871(-)